MKHSTDRPRGVFPSIIALLATLLTGSARAGVVGDGTPGSCTQNALATEIYKGGIVTFRCGGAVTIPVKGLGILANPNPLTVVVDGEGLVTLDGTGSTSGIVSVHGNKTTLPDVSFRNITFTKGAHTTGIISGGAINNGGKLTLENVTFASNTSFFGGAVAQQACSACLEPSTIARRCTFTGNRGDSSGGAIVVGGGLLSITDSTFRGNTGRYNGGIYLYLNGGMARTVAAIDRSTFEANSDEAGGGVIEISSLGAGGSATVTNSTFVGNSTTGMMAGSASVLHGGGPTTTLSSLTISGNTGGAGTAAVSIANSTVMSRSIVSGNTPRNCGAGMALGTASVDNLQWGDATCAGFASGDPRLGLLAANGGPTTTALPGAGGAAIDAIRIGRCGETVDQRGSPRPSGLGCDLGAVEVSQAPTPVFVPVVLSASGRNGSYFTSEMTLSLRGTRSANVTLGYAPFLGSGGGTLRNVLTLSPQKQMMIPDVLEFLAAHGLALPAEGSRGGTLTVAFEGLERASDASVTVRTASAVPPGGSAGRAGLAYSGVPAARLVDAAVALCGLREDDSDRTNVAVQNAGEGDVSLRLSYFRGEPASSVPAGTVDVTLGPGGFRQLSLPDLVGGGAPGQGWVRVERVAGSSPFHAYAVINDNVTSDGSYVPPLALGTSPAGLTLPVVVEANVFSTEVVVTNTSAEARAVRLALSADALPTGGASVDLEIPAFSQRILPAFVAFLRQAATAGSVPSGVDLVGPLTVRPAGTGSLAGISVSARVSNPVQPSGPGNASGALSPAADASGRYGVFFPAVPFGKAATTSVFLSGLQQNDANRSNLALVNTGEAGDGSVDLEVTAYDGATGLAVGSATYLVAARRLVQISRILEVLAPGTQQGFVKVRRTSGTNPFIAYAVVNDGALPGQRSGDGAFLAAED